MMSRVGIAIAISCLVWLASTMAFAGTIELTVPDTCAAQGDTLWLPIFTTDLTDSGVSGYDFLLKFDTTMVAIDSVTSTGTITEVWGDGFLVWAILEGQDTLRVAHAGMEPLTGSGILIRIAMRILPNVEDGSTCEISIPRANMRDDPTKPPVVTHSGILTIPCTSGIEDEKRQGQLLRIQRLGPSHLRCSLTGQGIPSGPMRIYDVHGHLVRSLKPHRNGHETSFSWKGFNDRMVAVAAGVYFYELATPQRRWTGKVAILR